VLSMKIILWKAQ